LGKFEPSENARIHDKSKFRASKFVQMAVFGPLKSLTLISHKSERQKFNKISTLCESDFEISNLY